MKALVVDDSKMMRMAVTKLLATINVDSAEAADGKEALDAVNAEPDGFRFVILDWNMPVMNGYEFLTALRADARFTDTMVIMVTTENQIDSIRKAIMAGANEYVMKPYTDEMLLEKVRMVIPELNE